MIRRIVVLVVVLTLGLATWALPAAADMVPKGVVDNVKKSVEDALGDAKAGKARAEGDDDQGLLLLELCLGDDGGPLCPNDEEGEHKEGEDSGGTLPLGVALPVISRSLAPWLLAAFPSPVLAQEDDGPLDPITDLLDDDDKPSPSPSPTVTLVPTPTPTVTLVPSTPFPTVTPGPVTPRPLPRTGGGAVLAALLLLAAGGGMSLWLRKRGRA